VIQISQPRHAFAIALSTGRRNANVLDRGLEFDQGVGLVVAVRRTRLAVCTEIGVMADGTLVTLANDVAVTAALAQRAIAANAKMVGPADGTDVHTLPRFNILIDGHETVVRVDESSIDNAVVAVVPVRAVEALVTDATDGLVTTITDGIVSLVPAGFETAGHLRLKHSPLDSGTESMLGVVPMLVLGEAGFAQVEVLAYITVDKVAFGQLRHARVAGADVLVPVALYDWYDSPSLGNIKPCSRCVLLLARLGGLGLRSLRLRGNALSGTIDERTVLDEPLDQPMV
jgi:hypothetical protein